ncbi:phosphate ABC transporter substrate-binding protein PstS [Imhoffiella purpurea]|uniref:Phosphate-binding protein PstS n=1 Tax=Imhoffiella purpurea TaxID=1249627 RepID=W9VQ99_9GAMM|nr:phosphate ABC transporter substrate-binding protein PstS [Imhoffiella purpurea]EXJ12625.1 Phosphate ABC transporter, periplasmic phosphate-binding protein PstS [Imhoffiella purpurea]
MKYKTSLASALAAAVAALGLLAGGQPAISATAEATELVVRGAGATFPQPLYQRWMQEYAKVDTGVRFSYEGVGSGSGVKRFLEGSVDFGASDAAMSDSELAKVDPKRGVEMIPMTAGMVVLAYNIPGVPEGLRLSRALYADILAGKVGFWDDARIQESNPDLTLPHLAIVTVVRRDSSGTTYVITNHLARIDPDWETSGPGIGKRVDWPGSAMEVQGNEGVARRVQITDGAIGYMAYEFAKQLDLPIATLQNKAGNFVEPGPLTGQAALASAEEIPENLRVYLPDPAGADAYPIVSYTWLLLDGRYPDPAKAEALKAALGWGLDEGQTIAAEMGYIPLPDRMIGKAKEALGRIR